VRNAIWLEAPPGDGDGLDHHPGAQARRKGEPLNRFARHKREEPRGAEVEGDAHIGRIESGDFDDFARQAVGDRHVHRPRQGDRHIACLDPDDDASPCRMIDQRRAQFAVLEVEDGHRCRQIVAQHACGDVRPEGRTNRCSTWFFQHV